MVFESCPDFNQLNEKKRKKNPGIWVSKTIRLPLFYMEPKGWVIDVFSQTLLKFVSCLPFALAFFSEKSVRNWTKHFQCCFEQRVKLTLQFTVSIKPGVFFWLSLSSSHCNFYSERGFSTSSRVYSCVKRIANEANRTS